MYFVKLFSPKAIHSRLKRKDGSTLIWALIVVVIITLVLAAGFNMVQRQQNSAVASHIESQAYFSAMSVNRAIIEWLSGTEFSFIEGTEYTGTDERVKFINWVLSKEEGKWHTFLLDKMDFPDTLGTFEIFVKHENGNIFLRTTATFNNESRTIVGTLTNNPSQTVKAGGPDVVKIEVPQPPEVPEATGLTLLNSGNVTGAAGKYYMTNRTGNFSGTMSTLVVQGTTNITFGGNVDLLVIKANANVNIGNPAKIGKLVIESGGTTSFQPNSKLYGWPDGTNTQAFVLAGGKFLNLATGQNQSQVIIYAYASDDPKNVAKVQLGKMTVIDIIVQPSNIEFGSYSADIGDPTTLDVTGKIHLPIGYTFGGTVFGLDNFNKLPASVLARVCNPVGTGIRPKEAPFCPHYLAKNEPPIITNTESWSSGGFFEE